MLPASLEGSPRSASGSDPDFFQTTASVLGLRAYEILHVPFKSGVSVSYSPSALPKMSPTGFQSQMFWGLISLMQDPQVGCPIWGSDPCSLGRISMVVIFLHLWITNPGMWILTISHLCPFYLSCYGSFFMSLAAENFFC